MQAASPTYPFVPADVDVQMLDNTKQSVTKLPKGTSSHIPVAACVLEMMHGNTERTVDAHVTRGVLKSDGMDEDEC